MQTVCIQSLSALHCSLDLVLPLQERPLREASPMSYQVLEKQLSPKSHDPKPFLLSGHIHTLSPTPDGGLI